MSDDNNVTPSTETQESSTTTEPGTPAGSTNPPAEPAPALTQTPPQTEPGQPEPPKYEYPQLDNPDAQSIVNVFAEKNIDPAVLNTVFEKALETGNLDDVDVKALKDAVGANADLIMGMARKVYEDNKRASEQAIQEVHGMFGGKESWEAMVAWAHDKANADPAFATKLNTYRSMIDIGGEQRRLAVGALKEIYMSDPNTTVHPSLLNGDQAPGGHVGNPIMSNREYSEALRAAYKQPNYADQVADIQRRWRAGAGAKLAD